ncbi:protein of unknown function (plasmid) [Cupriavidus taiwanensis]|uniref:Uncharacterized protein n=1 Tax=Cupriavidus taiwanensis TaxID=164546 RepID=A0A9Q7V1F3_9BURK|nr:protein of unknown function [Cupriavidus taiwanensis]
MPAETDTCSLNAIHKTGAIAKVMRIP